MSNIEKLNLIQENKMAKPLTGFHVLAMFLAFFGVIISVNFTMAWLASSSWTGLVVKNSYVASQEYNERLEAARIQKNRGWRMKFDYRSANVTVRLSEKNNDAVILSGLEMTIGRPSSESNDQTIILNHKGNGQYARSIDLAPGIWGFELNVVGEIPYHIEGRFIVSDKDIGTMQ